MADISQSGRMQWSRECNVQEVAVLVDSGITMVLLPDSVRDLIWKLLVYYISNLSLNILLVLWFPCELVFRLSPLFTLYSTIVQSTIVYCISHSNNIYLILSLQRTSSPDRNCAVSGSSGHHQNIVCRMKSSC